MSDEELREQLRELIDRQQITHVLMLYSRGIDRKDREALERVYWEDAIDDHAVYCDSAPAFIDNVLRTIEQMRTSHFLGNILIEFSNRTLARSETYFIATHHLDDADGRVDWTLGGRYIDLFEKRSNEWRIKERTVVADYQRWGPATEGWHGFRPRVEAIGGAKPADPLYQVFKPGAFPLPGGKPFG